MRGKKLIVFKIVVVLITLHHVVLTILYLGPVNPLSKIYGSYTVKYMHSFFAQNWEFFGRNLRNNWPVIQYKCNYDNEWKSFASGLLSQHSTNRFVGAGKKYYFYNHLVQKITDRYSKILAKDNTYPNELKEDIYFKFVMNLIGQSCKGEFSARLAIISQPKFSERGKKLSYSALPLIDFGIIKVSR